MEEIIELHLHLNPNLNQISFDKKFLIPRVPYI